MLPFSLNIVADLEWQIVMYAFRFQYGVGPTGAPAAAPGTAPVVASPVMATPGAAPTPSASAASKLTAPFLVLVAGAAISLLA